MNKLIDKGRKHLASLRSLPSVLIQLSSEVVRDLTPWKLRKYNMIWTSFSYWFECNVIMQFSSWNYDLDIFKVAINCKCFIWNLLGSTLFVTLWTLYLYMYKPYIYMYIHIQSSLVYCFYEREILPNDGKNIYLYFK